jgi:endonuclease/exonuclease/phosphatase family metal-dependent hydrolase
MNGIIKTLILGALLTGNPLLCPGNYDNSKYGLSEEVQESGYYYSKPEEGVLRILTYNIRNCIGMDGITDFDRIANVIKAINPHVVALQEVDKGTKRMDGIDVLRILAEKTGMHYEYGPAIDFQGGKYGNGVLSVEKPLSSSYIPLPGRQERRSLLMVEFEEFVLYGTHLNNAFPGDRHGSVMIIDYEAKDVAKPVFLAGDINDTPGTKTLELLSENWVQLSGNEYTFRSDRPDRCIDYIFGSRNEKSNYKVLNRVVVNEPVASDHLPVFVDVIIE